MASIIIGHTTHASAMIWVRGEYRHRLGTIDLLDADGADIEQRCLNLVPERDYTDVVTFEGLDPDTPYQVRVRLRYRFSRATFSIAGRFRTFVADGNSRASICFLLGSCNLTVVTLNDLLAMGLGMVGLSVARRSLRERLEAPYTPWQRILWWFRSQIRLLLKVISYYVYRTSRFKQPDAPVLSSPFQTLLKSIESCGSRSPCERPAFMLHLGDQIYYDFPFPDRKPSIDEYRLAYREAWQRDAALKQFLSSIPNYMILDDHEIVDQYSRIQQTRALIPARDYRVAALHVYDEYVHSRQPKATDGLYYTFECGFARFFVMDTRTERIPQGENGQGQMIDEQQMTMLESWLRDEKEGVSFVVSSVPFVGELTTGPFDYRPSFKQRTENDDKWCGPMYRLQRERIVRCLSELRSCRVVFLSGDSHCAYHAKLTIGAPRDRKVVHELASGPLYQLQMARRTDFRTCRQFESLDQGLRYAIHMEQFHTGANCAMRVTVNSNDRGDAGVNWEILRNAASAREEPVWRNMRGRIDFVDGANEEG